MTIDEIAKDILKKEDNQLAKAFTMTVGSLLISNGIQPIIIKSLVSWDENDDLNKYIIRKEYNVTFDIDTAEHDKKVREDAIDELVSWIKHEEADGKIHSLDDYDRIAKQLKEQNDDKRTVD